MAYRTTAGASQNTMLAFDTVEDARTAAVSEHMQGVLDGLRSVGRIVTAAGSEYEHLGRPFC